MEYLPSGELCDGRVTAVHSFGFDAACRLLNGERRVVSAQWESSGGPELANGRITVHG
jgi:hypothetical protein